MSVIVLPLPLPLPLSSGPTDIFSLFASESGSYATREDMEAMLQAVDGEIPISLRKCFSEVSSTGLQYATHRTTTSFTPGSTLWPLVRNTRAFM